MAPTFRMQVAVVAGRNACPPVNTCKASVAAGSSGPAADSFGGRHHNQGGAICLPIPVLKSRVRNAQQQESLFTTTALSSSYKQVQHQPVKHQRRTYIAQPLTRVLGNEAHPNPSADSSALIDIEEDGGGCITFKYGAVEDLWDLDRLLEFLATGAFSTHTAESFIRVVIELFRVPVSYTGKRRMMDVLSSHLSLHSYMSTDEAEKTVSQLLAEVASEFLPPTSVGSYSKGSARPCKRFTSRLDKWWKKLDNFMGVGEESVDFLPENEFGEFGGSRVQWSGYYENSSIVDEPLKPRFSLPLITNTTTQFTWKDPPSQLPWLACPSDRLYLDLPKTSKFELLRETESPSRPGGRGEGEYISGLDFIMLPSSQVESLEGVLKKTKAVKETAQEPDSLFTRPFRDVDTIPIASIQAMLEWEQEEMVVISAGTLQSKSKSSAKPKARRATTTKHQKKKTDFRVRGSTSSTKSASKKKSPTSRRNESQLCDMFFGLPISHQCSGVASFLAMRKNFGGEMLVILNQMAVGFAGVGVAVTLHVVARSLSVNSTFDSSKLFGLIRGLALMMLSAAMQSVRKVMLRLPAGCTVSEFKDKTDLLCLQHRLRRLSFTAMTVMVLSVVGHSSFPIV